MNEPTVTAPQFDLLTEYWQRQGLSITRQQITAPGVIATTTLAMVVPSAVGDDDEAQRVARLLQASPELLRLLRRLVDAADNTGAHAWSGQTAAEHAAALDEAEALIGYLTGD